MHAAPPHPRECFPELPQLPRPEAAAENILPVALAGEVDECELAVAQNIKSDHVQRVDGGSGSAFDFGIKVIVLLAFPKEQFVTKDVFVRRENRLARDASAMVFFRSGLWLRALIVGSSLSATSVPNFIGHKLPLVFTGLRKLVSRRNMSFLPSSGALPRVAGGKIQYLGRPRADTVVLPNFLASCTRDRLPFILMGNVVANQVREFPRLCRW